MQIMTTIQKCPNQISNCSTGPVLILGARMYMYLFSASMPCFKSRLTLVFTTFLTNLQIIESYHEIPFCPKELEFNPRGVSTRIKLQDKEKCKLFFMILMPKFKYQRNHKIFLNICSKNHPKVFSNVKFVPKYFILRANWVRLPLQCY